MKTRILSLLAVAALAAAACGSPTPTPAPSGVPSGIPASNSPSLTDRPTANPTTTSPPTLAGAADALANLTSYQFTMRLAGTDAVEQINRLVGHAVDPAGWVPFSGVVVTKPAKAVDLQTNGLHVIFVGGLDYVDIGNVGAFAKIPAGASSISDLFTPAQALFTIRAAGDSLRAAGDSLAGYSRTGYSLAGDAVLCDLYQADPPLLAELGASFGIRGATWSAKIWIASEGGYPVRVAVIATAADGTIPYEVAFELWHVNDPENRVSPPSNVVATPT